jgi:hypothetical protein
LKVGIDGCSYDGVIIGEECKIGDVSIYNVYEPTVSKQTSIRLATEVASEILSIDMLIQFPQRAHEHPPNETPNKHHPH